MLSLFSKILSQPKYPLINNQPDFAFVIHPLSKRDFNKVPGLSWFGHTGDFVQTQVAKWASRAPAFVWGEVNCITSTKTNKSVSGLIYTLSSTPEMLMTEPLANTYSKIQAVCEDAARRGAKIIGLGAYTKVIGDAGHTINLLSPIPVTTGNSLSAAATVWSLFEAIDRLKFIKPNAQNGLLDATVMVLGATGSIGSVSAKVLAQSFNRLVLVAPNLNKLELVKKEILKFNPAVEITVTSDPNQELKNCDAIVSATSAQGQKILDVSLIKRGTIVCDCSRPTDFSKKDALSRPDVLFIHSGELMLPGPIRQNCNLGLPRGQFYACLAEAAVLAMEESHVSFTLGRHLDHSQVAKIKALAESHGVKLSPLNGPLGPVTSQDIQRIRSFQIKKRAASSATLFANLN